MSDEEELGSWDDDDFEPAELDLTKDVLVETATKITEKEVNSEGDAWLRPNPPKEQIDELDLTSRASNRQYLYIMRHGDRWDEENPNWKSTASRPLDTPLSQLAHNQARETGLFLDALFHKDGIKSADDITLLSSPFLRCLQTSNEALNALTLPNAHQIRIKPEYCVSEWGDRHCQQLPSLQERLNYFPRLEASYKSMFYPRQSENPTIFWERCGKAATCIGKLPYHPNTAIVVASHAAVSIGLVEAAAEANLTWADVNPAYPCGVYRYYRTNARSWIIDMNGHMNHLSCASGCTQPYHLLNKKKDKKKR